MVGLEGGGVLGGLRGSCSEFVNVNICTSMYN